MPFKITGFSGKYHFSTFVHAKSEGLFSSYCYKCENKIIKSPVVSGHNFIFIFKFHWLRNTCLKYMWGSKPTISLFTTNIQFYILFPILSVSKVVQWSGAPNEILDAIFRPKIHLFGPKLEVFHLYSILYNGFNINSMKNEQPISFKMYLKK